MPDAPDGEERALPPPPATTPTPPSAPEAQTPPPPPPAVGDAPYEPYPIHEPYPGSWPPLYGQPGYGPTPWGQPGHGQPPLGQPGYGPPPFGQPGYGPPPFGQPGYRQPPLASFGIRMGAWLIDWLITSVVGAVVLFPLHAIHQNASAGTSSLTVSTQGVVLSALIVIIYGTACIGSRRGQTLGMMALRVRAVDANSGASISYARALGRALVEYVFLIALLVPWIIDMLFPLWDARRQTLHDKATNTVVVRV